MASTQYLKLRKDAAKFKYCIKMLWALTEYEFNLCALEKMHV